MHNRKTQNGPYVGLTKSKSGRSFRRRCHATRGKHCSRFASYAMKEKKAHYFLFFLSEFLRICSEIVSSVLDCPIYSTLVYRKWRIKAPGIQTSYGVFCHWPLFQEWKLSAIKMNVGMLGNKQLNSSYLESNNSASTTNLGHND